MKKRLYLRCLCEGAIMLALAQILGYIRFYRMPYGGSITIAMVPLIFFALRWGVKRGLLVSFIYGVMQLLLDGGYAYTWQSMILDYLVAYTPVGLAGLFKGIKLGFLPGTVLGVFIRFVSLTLSGVYVWAEYMPETFLGMAMTDPWVYSPIYNGIYMGLCLILCLIVLGAMYVPLKKYMFAQDIAEIKDRNEQ